MTAAWTPPDYLAIALSRLRQVNAPEHVSFRAGCLCHADRVCPWRSERTDTHTTTGPVCCEEMAT